MIINRNSWHYKVYDFTYVFSSNGVPQHTNLCQYVRRFGLVPGVALCVAALAVLMALIVTFSFIFGPIFGYRPRSWNPIRFFEHNMYKYQGLKLGKSYNAFQLYPWHVILAAIIVGVHVLMYLYGGRTSLIAEGRVVGIGVLVIAILLGLFTYGTTDTGRILNEYLAAKKQKVCPVVEFQNPQQENKS